MKDAINAVCVAGIMRGDGKTFRPTATITKVEFMAAMLNMIGESPIVNNTTTRQTATYNKALTLELVSNADLATFDRILTRYEAALLLYKLYVKNRFIASLNNNDVTHTIISSVQQDDMTAS
ncbi:S-layer homology domain-containing protein [Patescibacteria group bacterium]|nr:S-layer homology domain-containing protein [Patescibacteria group bacterium]